MSVASELFTWLERARRYGTIGDVLHLASPPTAMGMLAAYGMHLHERRTADDPSARDPEFVRLVVDATRVIGKLWYRHRIEGVDQVPAQGPALLVGNHNGGFLTFDTYLTLVAIWDRFGPGRAVHMLAHDFVFDDERLRRWALELGAIRASPESARSALARGDLVLVYPGSDLDTFRPFRDRNRIELGGRTGFLRLALRERVPIVPVVSVGTHEQFIVLSRGDRIARALRMKKWARAEVFPIVLSLPWGLTSGFFPYVPLPAQTTIAFGAPLRWSDVDPSQADDAQTLTRCYEDVRAAMQARLDAISAGRRPWLGSPRDRDHDHDHHDPAAAR